MIHATFSHNVVL